MAQAIFWSAALLLLHTYFFYPVVLAGLDTLGKVGRRLPWLTRMPRNRKLRADPGLPRVSLVVAAYNEVSCIDEKLDNSLALDYPADRFELLIGSDGSSDGTDQRVLARKDWRVRLSRAPRAGKTSVLNRCIPSASGDIVVLSDANTRVDPQALKRLVRHFNDPAVGAVCGKLKLFNPTRKEYEESAYWAYESLIKAYEGKHGAVMGANGGLYAIRRRLFRALPAATIVDDFVIPLRMMEKGYRVVYESEAVAFEETCENYLAEFGRRARIAAGNFQSLSMVPGLLSPRAGFRAFAFWSHKVLRWCAPALMAAVLLANLFLLQHPLYRLTLAMQLLFYALACAGKASLFNGSLRRAASVAYYFVTMNLALTVGFWRYLRNSQAAAWERTARA